jgi:hypothetical protein
MIDILFPFSYIGVCLGFLVGVGLTAATIGFLSAALIIILIYLGAIRIMPLLRLCKKVLSIFPYYGTAVNNIRESFKIRGVIPSERSIFMWHPHGVFCTSSFFHIATSLTDWSAGGKLAALSYLRWLPFSEEIFEEMNVIPNIYGDMKATLAENSLSVSPGGMREMLYKDTAILARRRGIFKMALETGTQLVPIVSVNEDRLCEIIDIPYIQEFLEPYDICICIPTLKSIGKFLWLVAHPLKDPVISVLGPPISVERVEVPSEAQISELRRKYISALKLLYKAEVGRELTII